MLATSAYTGIHPELLEVVTSGQLGNLEEFITRKIALDDVVEKGIKALLNEKDSHGELS